ncbi:hypothetical protein BDN71DRAFT_1429263 [Pleurotus eryngii]|uniref:Glucose-methanol-choline oxidoreductase C-terminal domain-containing protein n=1 Tax=Pleurotus eryngii TaxID=5323 RepID=A0A9P6A2V8_PLEER|nr:hypothetical protein BDN71DRAFT_1429263 [Pleurotus eryngii]
MPVDDTRSILCFLAKTTAFWRVDEPRELQIPRKVTTRRPAARIFKYPPSSSTRRDMLAWIGFGVILGRFSFGNVLMSASEMSTCYYFVVVGGGKASKSADRGTRLERATGSGEGVLDLEVPFLIPKLFTPARLSWNFTTLQAVLGGKSILYRRGHVWEAPLRQNGRGLESNITSRSMTGWQQNTISSESSSALYLDPRVIGRAILHVLLDHRLLPADITASSDVHFNGDEFKEIVDGDHAVRWLCEGSSHSRSFRRRQQQRIVRPWDQTIYHLPGVGQNLTEHPATVMQWFMNDTYAPERFTRNATLMGELLDEQKRKLSPERRLPRTISTETNWQLLERWRNYRHPRVPLNPLDHPVIDPAMLVHEFDRFALRETFRLIHRFITDIASVDFSDDDQLYGYFRHYATSAMHAVGSASMSPRGARWGVTDPDLKLQGVRGIRVVDASVIVDSIRLLVECTQR